MEMKKGDLIAVTVSREWADAVGPVDAIHYFEADDTPTTRLFVAKIISITDPSGLWVESANDPLLAGDKEPDQTTLFVPWQFIIAIRSSPGLKTDRHKLGFKNSN